jgi:hypothetical protein
VSPGGTEVGLSPKHGYNYLMKQVNDTQKAVEELDKAVDDRLHHGGDNMLTPTTTGHATLFSYIQSLYVQGVHNIIAKVNGFSDMPRQEWGFTLIAVNGEGDLWDIQLIEALTSRIFVRQLNTNYSWLQDDWSRVVVSPATEEIVFHRGDSMGSSRLVKNSSANADYGFSIRDYTSAGAEARINVIASEQVVSAAFKGADGELTNYELLHTGNFWHIAAPAGLVRSFKSVKTEEEINSAVDAFIADTKDNGQETFLLEVTLSSVVPSDLYFITIRKHMNNYVTVTGHGVISETENNIHRRKVNNVWTPWKLSSGGNVLPATVE